MYDLRTLNCLIILNDLVMSFILLIPGLKQLHISAKRPHVFYKFTYSSAINTNNPNRPPATYKKFTV